jgi:hypothetical protein
MDPRTLDTSANPTTVMVQIGNVISANIYVTSDAPLYHKGNTNLIFINVAVIFLFLLTKVYYITRNRMRDKKWNAMTTEVSHHVSHPNPSLPVSESHTHTGKEISADRMLCVCLGEGALPKHDHG